MTKDLNFEKALADLEELVKRMEGEDLPLAQALIEFEQGIGLIRQCQAQLQAAKQQVEKLMSDEDINLESDEKSG